MFSRLMIALALSVDCAYCLAKDGMLGKSTTHPRRQTFKKNNAVAALGQKDVVVPAGSRFVILLRGDTFRYEKDGVGRIACHTNSRDLQTNITTSLLTKIIEPLESQGNSIEIVFTSTPCELNNELAGILGGRIKASINVTSSGQAVSMRQALKALNDHYGGPDGVANTFDYVLIQRNDLQWMANVYDWQATWNLFNFLAHCEERVFSGKWFGGEKCVWDTLQLMPGRIYPAFNDAVGASADGYNCFMEDWNQNGHACYFAVSAALKKRNLSAQFGYLSDRYVPIRGGTDFDTEFCDLPLRSGP